MIKHMTMLQISVIGALTAIRRIIWYAFCMFVTSVVILVTRPAVLNLSILEKEKVCIFRYILSRRLQANPVDALAAFLPA